MTECYAYSLIHRQRALTSAAGEAATPAAARRRRGGACVAEVVATSSATHASSTRPKLLPAWEYLTGGSRGRQYAWDGRRLFLVDEHTFCGSDARDTGGAWSAGSLGRTLRRAQHRLWGALVPDVESVTSNYWDYARWRFVQRVAAQALTVLGTQQMLRAVGLGKHHTLPTAAALNWILKDGLGRLGKLSVSTAFGRTFDSDLKRSRFTSSVVYDAAALVEMCTPLAPAYFLALATSANIMKSIGITTALAVRPAMQQSFALEDNFGDIAARTQAQQVLADSAGLCLAVALGAASRRLGVATGPAGPLLFFPPLAAIDLWAIRLQLKCVVLRTLNKERTEIIAQQWLSTGRVPTHAEVAAQERMLIPARIDASTLPLDIRSLHHAARDGDDMMYLLRQPSARREHYVLAYRPASTGQRWRHGGSRTLRGRAILALQPSASAGDIAQALLQVAHLRCLPYRGDLSAHDARRWALEESYRRARRDRRAFLRALQDQHWHAEHILLSSAERAPFIT